LLERWEICEAVMRYLSARPVEGRHDLTDRLIGFQGAGSGKLYDPDEELLQRIRRLGLSFEPLSSEWVARSDGEWDYSEKSGHAVRYIFVFISLQSDDEAEVGINEWPTTAGGGQRFTYTLVRVDGVWTVRREKPGPILG
jgi:hypothetical protein